MKKVAVVLLFMLFIFCIFSQFTYANQLDAQISEYDIESLEKYSNWSNNYYTQTEGFLDTIKRFASGQEVLNVSNLIKALLGGFFDEAKGCLSMLASIIAISLVFSILNNINSSFDNKSVSEAAFFICYLIVISLVVNAFSEAADLVTSTIKSTSTFILAAAPVLTSMLVFSGAPYGATALNPVILFSSELLCVLAEKILIPILYSSAALYIVSEINETIRISKFADFLKKSVKWCLCLVMTIFVAVLGIQGFCTVNLDGTAIKTARFVVGSAIPVIGGILTDTIETVVGCSRIIKNATGATGVIAVLVMATAPVLKILAVSVTFNVGAAVIEPMADKRITSVLLNVASIISLMAAIIVVGVVVFIICIGMIMCLGNIF